MRTILALMLMTGAALADTVTRQTFQDANGRETGRSVTQNGRTTYYDNTGRQTGRSVTNQNGVTIIYDQVGRQVGTVKEKKK